MHQPDPTGHPPAAHPTRPGLLESCANRILPDRVVSGLSGAGASAPVDPRITGPVYGAIFIDV